MRRLLLVLLMAGLLAAPARAMDHLTRFRMTHVSGDGRIIVSSGTQVPWLMREDVIKGKIAFVSQPHGRYATALMAVNYDGSLIATTSGGEIKIWDGQLRLKHRLLLHSSGLVFSPNGHWLVSKDWRTSVSDGYLQLIDTRTFKVVRTIRGEIETTVDLIFTRDGKEILTGSGEGKSFYLIDVATGARHKVTLDFFAQSFAVSADDQTIFVGGTANLDKPYKKPAGRVASISRQSRQVLRQYEWSSPVTCLTLLPKLGLVIGDRQGEVNVFNLAIGDASRTFLTHFRSSAVYKIYQSKDNFLIIQHAQWEVSEIFLGREIIYDKEER